MEGTKLRNIVLYYLLYAIKELGINLPLLFRRITETAAKDIEYISKEFYGGKMSVTDLSQAAKDWCNMLKQEKLVEDISIEFKDNEIDMGVSGCSYLDVAIKAKSRGEKGCPVCLIALAASVAATAVSGISFNAVEYSTNIDEKKCLLKIFYTKS
ncbi:MAG: hypothetical protein ACTSVA_07155 [Candidatus Njordarchaeales archaeon]